MKRIESPSKRWPGHVLLHDPFTMEQGFLIEEAQDKTAEEGSSSFLTKVVNQKNEKTGELIRVMWHSRFDKNYLPAIFACVAEWHLENTPEPLTIETLQSSMWTPRPKSHELIQWLFDEIQKIYDGEIEVPNE